MGIIFKKLLTALRNFMKGFGASFFKSSISKKDGVSFFKGELNPKIIRLLALTIFVTILSGLFLYRIMTNNKIRIDGAEEYKKEQKNAFGVKTTELEKNFEGLDPLAGLGGLNPDAIIERKQISIDSNGNDISYSKCNELYSKFKSGEKFSEDEELTFKECIKSNVLGLNADELKSIKEILDNSGLSVAEQALLKSLMEENKSCMLEIDKQKQTTDGKLFLDLIFSANPPTGIIDLLSQQKLITMMEIDPEKTRKSLGLSVEDFTIFNSLLKECGSGFLKRLMTDPELRALLNKIIKSEKGLEALLSDPNLTDAEKELLRKYLDGTLSSDDAAIAEALMGIDPIKKQMASDLLKAREMGDQKLADVLLKQLNGEPLTPEEQLILDNYNKNKDKINEAYNKFKKGDPNYKSLLKQIKGEDLTKSEIEALNQGIDPMENLSESERLKALAKALVDDQNKLNDITDALNRAQVAAKTAAQKILEGKLLTNEEKEALKRYNDLEKQRSDLIAQMDKRKEEYTSLLAKLSNVIDTTGVTVKQVYPYLEADEGFIKCSDLKPIQIVKLPKKQTKKITKAAFVDSNGNELSPEKIRLLQLIRKKEADAQSLRKALLNPLSSGLYATKDSIIHGDNNDTSLRGGDRSKAQINTVVLGQNTEIATSPLPPDLKIPGILLTEILISDKDPAPTEVRVKIASNVLNPLTSEVLIPKGSIAIGKASSFDPATKTMNVSLPKISIGSNKVLDISLSVGSADLSPVLRGEVYDTKTKELTGAFVSSFTTGALSAFAQQYISPLENSDYIGENVTGSILTGGAEVARMIQENFAQSMQNAPKVFYVPANIPVVLTPQ